MKALKKINNNVAICIDSDGRECIAMAKGIGFKVPQEIDIKDVDRTFYDVDPRYMDMMEVVDERIINIAIRIKLYSDSMNLVTGSNLLFSLIDHINYALERNRKGIFFNLPIARDIKHLFQKEMEIGNYGLTLINKEFDVLLPKDEATYIAMNIINSETEVADNVIKENTIISNISKIVENCFDIEIDRDSVAYSRFESHMRYLLKANGKAKEDKYTDLLNTVKERYEEDYLCVKKIEEYVGRNYDLHLTGDEFLFIAMHVNKLRTKS